MRYVKVVTVVAALMLVLAACGDDGGGDSADSDGDEATEETEDTTEETSATSDAEIAENALLDVAELPDGFEEFANNGNELVDLVAETPVCAGYVNARVGPDETAVITFRRNTPSRPFVFQWVDVYADVEDAEESYAAVADTENDLIGCLEAYYPSEGGDAEGREFDVEAGEESVGYEVDLRDPQGDTGTFYLAAVRDGRAVVLVNTGLVSETERDEIIDAAAEKLNTALGK